MLDGDSVVYISDGAAKVHDLYGEGSYVGHFCRRVADGPVVLGRRTSQGVALEIGRTENVSKSISQRLLPRHGALLLQESIANGICVGAEANLGLRQEVLGEVLRLELCLAAGHA